MEIEQTHDQIYYKTKASKCFPLIQNKDFWAVFFYFRHEDKFTLQDVRNYFSDHLKEPPGFWKDELYPDNVSGVGSDNYIYYNAESILHQMVIKGILEVVKGFGSSEDPMVCEMGNLHLNC